jgi:nucleotide-binding universal stress UspA family protein
LSCGTKVSGVGSEAFVYKRMMVAYDESPEAKRALARAIELAKVMGGGAATGYGV